MIRPAQSSASSFPVSYLIYLLPGKLQYCNIIIYRVLFILFLVYIIFYFWVVTWGKNKKKLSPGKLPLPFQNIDSKICSQKKCLPENPWKNKCARKYTNLKNTVYIAVVLFAIVFGIFEGRRNVETLIAKILCHKISM